MRISRENYELFFIDYLDGALSDRQIGELEDFLLWNPDLREELEGLEKVKMIPDKPVFHDKDILRKIDTTSPLSEANFDDYCVAYMENDLDPESKAQFELYLSQYPGHQKDLALYREAILSPDATQVFHEKDRLKKPVPVKRLYLYTALSAAAAIALLMVIFWRTEDPGSVTAPLAEITEKGGVPDKRPEGEITIQNFQTDTIESISLKKVILPETSSKQEDLILAQATDAEENYFEEPLQPSAPYYQSLSLMEHKIALVDIPGARPDVIQKQSLNIKDPELFLAAEEPEYLSLPEIALKYVNNILIKNDLPIPEPSGVTIWEVADVGIKGINRLTGSEMKLEKQTGVNGETKGVNIDIGFFGFSRSVR